ncbi:hypothetical protein INT48_008007 [Thamnidium elegans]|uniref:PLC-like phosphodiesterase n=1 Tax=Thamnidium elegans TaxID=101142 RepID=A0A8H7SKG3_9FUNG|nr:hypothetical protein INT48_008007 [Thamnidium elegans]
MVIGFLILVSLFTTIQAECNGGSSLCDMSYSDITQLITHDSYALSPNIAATQDYTIIDQLNDGVRGIKLTAVPSIDDPLQINLCHTFCRVLDAGPATETLNTIATWLEENPKEVVTIMWNNLNNFKATELAQVYESSDIMPMVFTHSIGDEWPTIQSMIDAGKRVVNFIDAEADSDQVPWLMDQFSRVFETPYDNTDIDAFNCNVDRIGDDLNPDDLMYVMNHFMYANIDLGTIKVQIPLRSKALITNSRESLTKHANNCTDIFQKKPSFIEVDFYTMGDALDVVAEMNGVTSVPLLSSRISVASRNVSSPVAPHAKLSPTDHVFIDNSLDSSGLQSHHRTYLSVVLMLFLSFSLIIRL